MVDDHDYFPRTTQPAPPMPPVKAPAVSVAPPLAEALVVSLRAMVNIVEGVMEEGKARIYPRDRENLSRALSAIARYEGGER